MTNADLTSNVKSRHKTGVGWLTATLFGGIVLAVGLLSLPSLAMAQNRDKFRDDRSRMVTDTIEREGVKNPRVLASMRQVPRHEFVPPSLRAQSYFDQALPIGHKQTISPPFIVAYMTETLDPQADERVLEIGTGSGYQAAVLSSLCKEVYSIEIVEPLGKQAAERLKRLRYDNVKTKVGDGYAGWPEVAPFDKIIVTCSPEKVPQPLIDQLREGGKMIIPLGERYQQVFYLFEKQQGELKQTKLIPTLFVPMTGVSEDQREVKPDPLNPTLLNPNFELDKNEDGLADFWHYQRQASLGTDSPPEGKHYFQLENREFGRMAQALQGFAIDGSQINQLTVSLKVKVDDLRQGPDAADGPAILIHFYDDQRKTISDVVMGPWLGTSGWESATKTIPVPPKTREAILRISLNGNIGRMSVDDIRMSTKLAKGK